MFASLNHKEYSQMRKQAHLKGGQEILCYDESASDMACIHLFRRNISRWYRWQFFYTFYCNPCSMSLKKMDNDILDYVVSNDFIYTYLTFSQVISLKIVLTIEQHSFKSIKTAKIRINRHKYDNYTIMTRNYDSKIYFLQYCKIIF